MFIIDLIVMYFFFGIGFAGIRAYTNFQAGLAFDFNNFLEEVLKWPVIVFNQVSGK